MNSKPTENKVQESFFGKVAKDFLVDVVSKEEVTGAAASAVSDLMKWTIGKLKRKEPALAAQFKKDPSDPVAKAAVSNAIEVITSEDESARKELDSKLRPLVPPGTEILYGRGVVNNGLVEKQINIKLNKGTIQM